MESNIKKVLKENFDRYFDVNDFELLKILPEEHKEISKLLADSKICNFKKVETAVFAMLFADPIKFRNNIENKIFKRNLSFIKKNNLKIDEYVELCIKDKKWFLIPFHEEKLFFIDFKELFPSGFILNSDVSVNESRYEMESSCYISAEILINNKIFSFFFGNEYEISICTSLCCPKFLRNSIVTIKNFDIYNIEILEHIELGTIMNFLIKNNDQTKIIDIFSNYIKKKIKNNINKKISK